MEFPFYLQTVLIAQTWLSVPFETGIRKCWTSSNYSMITESNSRFQKDFLGEKDPPARNHKLFICVQQFLQSSK